jgi:hypothetical protein
MLSVVFEGSKYYFDREDSVGQWYSDNFLVVPTAMYSQIAEAALKAGVTEAHNFVRSPAAPPSEEKREKRVKAKAGVNLFRKRSGVKVMLIAKNPDTVPTPSFPLKFQGDSVEGDGYESDDDLSEVDEADLFE